MMTPLDERRIRNLRHAGWGYKNIANFTGLTRDQIRAYCQNETLTEKIDVIEHVCAWCGLSLEGRSPQARYCSRSCRWAGWAQRRGSDPERTRTCAECGKPVKSRQKYCSHACYIRDRFATRGGRS